MRYKITIEYDGTNLLGWQRQLDGPSAQQYLEEALNIFAGETEYIADCKNATIRECSQFYEETSTGKCSQVSISDRLKSSFNEEDGSSPTERNPAAYIQVREEVSTGECSQVSIKKRFVEVIGAGRTDAGVHATGQVAHFDMKRQMEPWRVREAFNANLRNLEAPVSVLEVEVVSNDFHARFSAKGRGYVYKILNRRAPSPLLKNGVWWIPVELNVEKMRQAAAYLIGHHDFSSFRASACQALSPVKTLDKIDIIQNGDEIIFTVEARSFLHHQVRNIVGTLKMVGDGHWQPEDVKRILEACDRTKGGPTAPASGLYLTHVVY